MPKEEKQGMVRDIFSKVAENYDVMNDVMSVGAHRFTMRMLFFFINLLTNRMITSISTHVLPHTIHLLRLWKDELVSMLDLRAISRVEPILPLRFLDVAGGTGDVGFRIAQELEERFSLLESREDEGGDGEDKRKVVICDINPEMLAVGKNRADRVLSKTSRGYVGFVEGNAECLPFEDNSFDFYTIAFGLRNVTNKDLALKEAYRVLRKGGRLLIMEFSQVQNPVLRSVYDQYSFNVIPKLGGRTIN